MVSPSGTAATGRGELPSVIRRPEAVRIWEASERE
jgi:hypothetical protein